MRPWLITFLLVASTASQAQWAPTQAQWHSRKDTGIHLNRVDGSRLFISGEIITNILKVKADIEAVSGVAADFGLLETDNPSVSLTEHKGRTLILFTTRYLDHLGHDLDALAVTIGHELAHLYLGHARRTTRDQEREADELGLQWAIEAGYNPCGKIRVVALMARTWPVMPISHPSHQARADMANKYAKKATGKEC